MYHFWKKCLNVSDKITQSIYAELYHLYCQGTRGSSANFFIVVDLPNDWWASGIFRYVEPSVSEVVLNGFLLEWIQHKEGVLGSSGEEEFTLNGPCPAQYACPFVGFVTPVRLCR